jgi:hypothetical protein
MTQVIPPSGVSPCLDFNGGFFVETGTNDDLNRSSTCDCERYHGWCQLLIEPIPERAARCRAHHPRALRPAN